MTVHTCAHSKMPQHNIVNNVKLFSHELVLYCFAFSSAPCILTSCFLSKITLTSRDLAELYKVAY